MALDVVGAGFGRTGTESMKRALETLGFGPRYHMYEVMPHKERYAHWLSIYNDGADPCWDETFAGFRSTVDWPGQVYWLELAAHYPEAKTILTVRSSESWFSGIEKTILPMFLDPEGNPGLAKSIGREVFGDRFDRESLIASYECNIAEVQASFRPERLLTYEFGDGWESLCVFLGVVVPEGVYPSGNATEEFQRKDVELTAVRKDAEGRS